MSQVTNAGEAAASILKLHSFKVTQDFLSQLSDAMLTSMTVRQKSFIIGKRLKDENIEGTTQHYFVADEFPPGILSLLEIAHIGGIWSQLRPWLVRRGIILQLHSYSRIIMILVTGIYENAEDRNIATEYAQKYLISQRKSQNHATEDKSSKVKASRTTN